MRMKKRKTAAEMLLANRDKCCGDCVFYTTNDMCELRRTPLEVFKNKRACAWFKEVKK